MVVRERLVYAGIARSEMGGEQGDLLLGSTWHKRGSLEFNGYCYSSETSVGMYKLKETMEEFCSDLLASHQRKCDCALVGMTTWRFSSH
jgi:hypothetical protein